MEKQFFVIIHSSQCHHIINTDKLDLNDWEKNRLTKDPLINSNLIYSIREKLQIKNSWKEKFDKNYYHPLMILDEGETFSFSMAHKFDQVFMVLDRLKRRVGCDIEALNQEVDWSVFSFNFFNYSDQRLITFLESKNVKQVELKFFCAKESIIKIFQREIDSLDISFTLIKLDTDKICLRFNNIDCEVWTDDKFVYSVAYENSGPQSEPLN